MILLGMQQIDNSIDLLEFGLKQAPISQLPYYRRLLLAAQLRSNAKNIMLEEPILTEDTAIEEKVIYLHLYALKRQVDKAKQLAQQLARQQSLMSEQTRHTYEQIKTTFCHLNKKDCQPSQRALALLYEAEDNMLAAA